MNKAHEEEMMPIALTKRGNPGRKRLRVAPEHDATVGSPLPLKLFLDAPYLRSQCKVPDLWVGEPECVSGMKGLTALPDRPLEPRKADSRKALPNPPSHEARLPGRG